MLIPILYMAAALAAGDDTTQTQANAAAPSESPAMAQARANLAIMKTRPELQEWHEPAYPAAEVAIGNGGFVKLRGIVNIEGRYDDVVVVETTADAVLTDAALAAAKSSRFLPAKDAAGRPIAVPVGIPFTFSFNDVRPEAVTYVEPAFGDVERADGAHGWVTVGGFVGADGQLRDARVLVSSRSPVLDQSALTAAQASQFRPGKGDSGNAVDLPARLTYSFAAYGTKGAGGGISQYRCDQFARDQVWWRTTWPERPKDEVYKRLSAIGWGARLMTSDASQLQAYDQAFATRWDKAVADCQAKPDVPMVDMIQPEGRAAVGLGE